VVTTAHHNGSLPQKEKGVSSITWRSDANFEEVQGMPRGTGTKKEVLTDGGFNDLLSS
jgi:hypothetical protein